MSGLAKLLAGHTQPGVYRWPTATSPGDVRHAVQHAGWHFISLDTWAVDDKSSFLDACEEAFAFPDWVAHNFDALGDALTDVKAPEDGGVVVLWDGWAPLARAARQVFDVAVTVFADRVDLERAGQFAVLLRGPGPDDVQLPELDPHRF
jgi:hypothetical protein